MQSNGPDANNSLKGNLNKKRTSIWQVGGAMMGIQETDKKAYIRAMKQETE